MEAILLSFALALGSRDVVSREPLPGRIGTIMIFGNVKTDADLIHKILDLKSGQPRPSEAAMLQAERRLIERFGDLLDLNSIDGSLLEFTLSKFDGEYHDLSINFTERNPAERRRR